MIKIWINGRIASQIDCRDRGLNYGDGLFETLCVTRRIPRLLDYHLERLYSGCERLKIIPPKLALIRHELEKVAALRNSGVLKLVLTRGVGARGYRPTGRERCVRILALYPFSRVAAPRSRTWHVRLCTTRLGTNITLAGLKTLNRLESVMARSEWQNSRIAEGLMMDADENIVCGTMSNLFVRRGTRLMTPLLDRCGVAGVMRRWVLSQTDALNLKAYQLRLRWKDIANAEEVFMCNALVGIVPIAKLIRRGESILPPQVSTAVHLQRRLDLL